VITSMPQVRKWTTTDKKIVGARQSWRCHTCDTLLPASYEVDHVIPLWNGGIDDLQLNAVALCNTCHAQKTIHERVKMHEKKKHAIETARVNILDAEIGIDFFSNRFLKYAYTPPS